MRPRFFSQIAWPFFFSASTPGRRASVQGRGREGRDPGQTRRSGDGEPPGEATVSFLSTRGHPRRPPQQHWSRLGLGKAWGWPPPRRGCPSAGQLWNAVRGREWVPERRRRAARSWREMGWQEVEGVHPLPPGFQKLLLRSALGPPWRPEAPEEMLREHPPSPLLGPQQQPGSREAGSFQRSVVWVCLCFCNRELRFISLKHPISRHPAICSALR